MMKGILVILCFTLIAVINSATIDDNHENQIEEDIKPKVKYSPRQKNPNYGKRQRIAFPGSTKNGKIKARERINTDVIEKTEKSSVKNTQHIVHGKSENDIPESMSPDAKSKFGCMKTMKQQNGEEISDDLKKSSCDMYMQWGRNMRSQNPWNPTDGQIKWWKSLSVDSKLQSRNPHAPDHRSPRQSGSGKALRKEYRMMTDDERNVFHESVRILKNNAMDGTSKYDLFVNSHQANTAPGAHFGPGFFGYHREILLRFENALREINPTVSLPYWDSNLDNHLGDDLAQVSMLWTKEFLGNGKGDVRTGPFAYWSIPNPVQGKWTLHRNLTVKPPNARTDPALMSDQAVEIIINARTMRDLTWFVDTAFESHHGATHNWIGGVMGDLPNSPADPIFFMHHAFIDCLWEQMRSRQRLRQDRIDPRFDYPNDSSALGVGIIQPDGVRLDEAQNSRHYSMNIMEPFTPYRNIDGLRNEYFEEFYTCDPSPRCSSENKDCGSPYLFCDTATYRCAPKLQIEANCSRFADSAPCHKGYCCLGTCMESCSKETQTQLTRNPGVIDPTRGTRPSELNEQLQRESENRDRDLNNIRVQRNRDSTERRPRTDERSYGPVPTFFDTRSGFSSFDDEFNRERFPFLGFRPTQSHPSRNRFDRPFRFDDFFANPFQQFG